MEYKLLDNMTGVVLTRSPEVVAGEMTMVFKGAPACATVILECDGQPYYRPLIDGVCHTRVAQFSGSVKVTVVEENNSARPARWRCEPIKVTPMTGNRVFVSPDDGNMPEEVVRLRQENEQIRMTLAAFGKRLAELSEELENIREGYNIL